MNPSTPWRVARFVLGFIARFERTAAANAHMLNDLASTGVPLVGLDPSMTLAYRAEYAKALGQKAAPKVSLPQEWLAEHLDAVPVLEVGLPAAWGLLPHCTERTNAPAATSAWAEVCARFGIDMRILRTGCCGMAGLYGHEKANRATSQAIYELSWSKAVSDPGYSGRLAATGYSCRCQAALQDDVQLPHPVQVLLARMKSAPVRTRDAVLSSTRVCRD